MSVAPYVSSPKEAVRKMLDMAQLRRGEVLYDLGCGDGRIVVIAARDYQAKAFGVEIREDVATAAQQQLKKFDLEEKARIIHRNLFDVDLSEADVVTLYLSLSGNEKLKPKLERELKTNARVVSLDIQIKGWTPIHTSEAPGKHIIYLYKIKSHSGRGC
jgi:predicted RNA methylase